jgi:hypothetical protein
VATGSDDGRWEPVIRFQTGERLIGVLIPPTVPRRRPRPSRGGAARPSAPIEAWRPWPTCTAPSARTCRRWPDTCHHVIAAASPATRRTYATEIHPGLADGRSPSTGPTRAMRAGRACRRTPGPAAGHRLTGTCRGGIRRLLHRHRYRHLLRIRRSRFRYASIGDFPMDRRKDVRVNDSLKPLLTSSW